MVALVEALVSMPAPQATHELLRGREGYRRVFGTPSRHAVRERPDGCASTHKVAKKER